MHYYIFVPKEDFGNKGKKIKCFLIGQKRLFDAD